MLKEKFVFCPPEGRGIVLASASPRRKDLLRQIGINNFKIEPADIDERELSKELPNKYVLRIAKQKAEVVSNNNQQCFVIAADTIVTCGRRILHKAETRSDASDCLNLLSGRRHKVLSAVVINSPNGNQIFRTVTSVVTFKKLDKEELNAYLGTDEWEGKAGGYAIQGLAATYIRALNGSYSNVVGLPLHETYQLLKGMGFNHKII